MPKESIELMRFRSKWVGKRVCHGDCEGIVVGVCDDGSQCDFDQRRKAKPTGLLIVKNDFSTREFYWHEDKVSLIDSN